MEVLEKVSVENEDEVKEIILDACDNASHVVLSEASEALSVKDAISKFSYEGVKSGDFDYMKEYPDEYYDEYIKSFVPNPKPRRLYRFMKRAFDITASLIMLICLSPMFLIVSLLIICESRGGAIFKHERIGKDGKPFMCYKFRSMRIDAPKSCPTSQLENPDQYLTRVGKFIRKISLDELPQIWCVLTGKMSFIGYRPLVPKEENCNEMRRKLGVLKFRPGISGYAQITGRDDVYYKNKAVLDSIYTNRASFFYDMKLIVLTITTAISKKGNDAAKDTKKDSKE